MFIRSIELSQRNLRAYNFHTTKRLKRTFARELIDESNAMGYKNMSLIFAVCVKGCLKRMGVGAQRMGGLNLKEGCLMGTQRMGELCLKRVGVKEWEG